MEVRHTIPLGTLVEVDISYSEYHGVRAYIVKYERDCDGTPLYGLGMSKDLEDYEKCGDEIIDYGTSCKIAHGFDDSSLIIIR